MNPLPHPPWHHIYPPTTDITHLTSVIVDHARYVATLARRALSASVTSASASFNSANDTADASIASPSLATVLAAASRVRGYKHLMLTAALVWRRLTLRHKQNVSVETLVFDPICEGKLLVVDRTGGGKSLIMQLAATMVGGIVLVVIPLLALTANQLAKIKQAISTYGSVEAHHLDEISAWDQNSKIIPRMHAIGTQSSSTMFLLCSPQHLADDSDI